MVNFSFAKHEVVILAVLLLFAFAVRLLMFPLQGYQNDMSTFVSWFNTAAENGVRPFYTVLWSNPATAWVDYPPLNIYLFWVFGSIAKLFSGIDPVFFVKLVPTLFDIATSALIFLFLRRYLTLKQNIVATALYAFNPAIIFNVAVWGQFDAIYTFLLMISLILALKRKPEASAIVFALGILTKPQGIALLPLIVLLIFKKDGLKRLLTSIAAFLATIFVVILPFEWNNPITFLSRIYFGAYGNYQYTSINAFNLWGLFGLWMPDGNLYILGWALFAGFSAFTLYVLHKRFHASGEMLAVFAAFLLFFAFFMLPTRIHERYLFPAISMLVLLVPFAKKIRLLYAALTATLFVNQAYVLAFLNSPNPFIPQGDLVVLAVSVINLVMFLYASVLMWDQFRDRQILTDKERLNQPEERAEPSVDL